MAAQPPPFSAEETAAAREVFALMDADSDGKVNHSDLKKFFDEAGWGLNDDNIAGIIKRGDKDGTGTISWDEFLKVAETRPIRRRIINTLRQLFQKMDVDNTGFVTAANLRELLKKAGASDEMSDADINAMIASADKTGDGKVSFEEFLEAFLSQ